MSQKMATFITTAMKSQILNLPSEGVMLLISKSAIRHTTDAVASPAMLTV
jgi:hypothetical protein